MNGPNVQVSPTGRGTLVYLIEGKGMIHARAHLFQEKQAEMDYIISARVATQRERRTYEEGDRDQA